MGQITSVNVVYNCEECGISSNDKRADERFVISPSNDRVICMSCYLSAERAAQCDTQPKKWERPDTKSSEPMYLSIPLMLRVVALPMSANRQCECGSYAFAEIPSVVDSRLDAATKTDYGQIRQSSIPLDICLGCSKLLTRQ